MSTALFIAIPLLAYLLPTVILWRRYAARSWAAVERGKELRKTLAYVYKWNAPDRQAFAALEREAKELHKTGDLPGLSSLWVDNKYATPPTQMACAGDGLLRAALWPVLVTLGGCFALASKISVAVTNPTRDERRRRQLAAARENVARLEAELGIGKDEVAA